MMSGREVDRDDDVHGGDPFAEMAPAPSSSRSVLSPSPSVASSSGGERKDIWGFLASLFLSLTNPSTSEETAESDAEEGFRLLKEHFPSLRRFWTILPSPSHHMAAFMTLLPKLMGRLPPLHHTDHNLFQYWKSCGWDDRERCAHELECIWKLLSINVTGLSVPFAGFFLAFLAREAAAGRARHDVSRLVIDQVRLRVGSSSRVQMVVFVTVLDGHDSADSAESAEPGDAGDAAAATAQDAPPEQPPRPPAARRRPHHPPHHMAGSASPSSSAPPPLSSSAPPPPPPSDGPARVPPAAHRDAPRAAHAFDFAMLVDENPSEGVAYVAFLDARRLGLKLLKPLLQCYAEYVGLLYGAVSLHIWADPPNDQCPYYLFNRKPASASGNPTAEQLRTMYAAALCSINLAADRFTAGADHIDSLPSCWRRADKRFRDFESASAALSTVKRYMQSLVFQNTVVAHIRYPCRLLSDDDAAPPAAADMTPEYFTKDEFAFDDEENARITTALLRKKWEEEHGGTGRYAVFHGADYALAGGAGAARQNGERDAEAEDAIAREELWDRLHELVLSRRTRIPAQ